MKWFRLAALALIVPSFAEAQNTAISVTRVEFAPGSAQRDGYASASMGVAYHFQRCFGNLMLIWNIRPGDIRIGSGYYFGGSEVSTSGFGRPDGPSVLSLRGSVRRGAGVVTSVRGNPTGVEGSGCYFSDAVSIGTVANLVGAGATDGQIQAYLQSLSLSLDEASVALRNPEIEAAERRRIRAQRDDSLAALRVEQARLDSLARLARADSLRSARRLDSLARVASLDSARRANARADSAQARSRSLDSARALARRDSIARVLERQRLQEERRRLEAERARDGYATGRQLFETADRLWREGQVRAAAGIYRHIAYDYGFYTEDQRAVARQRAEAAALAEGAAAIAEAGKLVDQALGPAFERAGASGIHLSLAFGANNGFVAQTGLAWISRRLRGVNLYYPIYAGQMVAGVNSPDEGPWKNLRGFGGEYVHFLTPKFGLAVGAQQVGTKVLQRVCTGSGLSYECSNVQLSDKSVVDPTLALMMRGEWVEYYVRAGSASSVAVGFLTRLGSSR